MDMSRSLGCYMVGMVGANSKERFKKLSSNRKRAINTELKRLLGK